MKKVIYIVLVVILSVSVFGFAGCGGYDDSALLARIAELERKLEDLENYDDSVLKARITNLENLLENLEDYDDSAIKAQIHAISEQLQSLSGYDDAELRAKLDEFEIRIQLLEAAVGTDTNKIYEMGEVFTLRSAGGLELFRIRLIDLYDNSGTYMVRYNIQNINLPKSANLHNYFTIFIYYNDGTTAYKSLNPTISGDDFNAVYNCMFSLTTVVPENIEYYVVGLPSDNNVYNNSSERNYVIPYALYNPNSD